MLDFVAIGFVVVVDVDVDTAVVTAVDVFDFVVDADIVVSPPAAVAAAMTDFNDFDDDELCNFFDGVDVVRFALDRDLLELDDVVVELLLLLELEFLELLSCVVVVVVVPVALDVKG